MDQIQLQASKLWELLFSEATAETYQNALNLTGKIIKETGQLLWLTICSVFVFGAWVGDTSLKTGNGVRTWIDQQSNPDSSGAEKKPMAETGKELLATGRTGVDYLLNQAREQLGLEPVEPAPVKKPISKPKAAKNTAPKATPAASKPAAATSAPAKTATAATPVAAPTEESETTEEVTRETVEEDWPPQESE